MKKRVAIFGIGRQFMEYIEEINSKYEIVCLADNASAKQGNYWRDFKILNPEEMMEHSFDYVLVVPNYNKMEIIKGLRQMGISNERIVPWIPQGSTLYKRYYTELLDESILFYFDDIRIKCSTTSDFICLDDVFVHNTYDFYMPISVTSKTRIMVDIGMNIGLGTIFFANMVFIDKVYAYEPVKATYEYALQNIALNEKLLPKIHPYNIGLGNKNETMILAYDVNRSDCTSIFHQGGVESASVHVRIARATDILQNIILQNPDSEIYVKINAEGAEYPVISDLHESGLIKKIKFFIMDVHFGRENELKRTFIKDNFIYFDRYGKNGHSIFYAVQN